MNEFLPTSLSDDDIMAKNKSGRILNNVYHKSQSHIWDGKQVLADLVTQHGPINLENKESMSRILSLVLWGELAAWNVSAHLAGSFNDLESKLAATSQAHDESRHYYVLKDYMDASGCKIIKPSKASQKMIKHVMTTQNDAKKILGMHLMVEPIALTIFRQLRVSNVEPVLCNLLRYFEIDEARHVALGVHHLPIIMEKMNAPQILDVGMWQMRMLFLEVDGLREMSQYFVECGVDPKRLYDEAEEIGHGV